MNPKLLLPLAACAGFTLTGCDKPAPAAAPSTPAPVQQASAPSLSAPAPEIPAGPSEAELKLEKQVRDMELRELELLQQVEEQRLAATEKEIEKERALLEKEREAFLLEQQLAEAKKAPVRSGGRDEESGVPGSKIPAYAPGKSFDYQTFYDDLDPLGSWFDSPDYGYVWQPSVYQQDRSWRPYTRGRWVNTDQDWTWASDEPFGWACYHYGRWAFLDGRGWIWVPGDQWAPAWVSWRKNDNYVGWCPLPPETVYDYDITYGNTIDRDCGIYPASYVFMPVRHFDQPVLGHCEAPAICLTIFSTTINITNITIRRDRVQCSGPRREWIAERMRRNVPRYTLAHDHDRRDNRDHRAIMDKDKVRFYAPRVNAPWNADLRPSRAAESLAGARVMRGEGGIPSKAVNRFETAKQERVDKSRKMDGSVGKNIIERQRRLADLEKTRESLQGQLSRNPEILAGKKPGQATVPGADTSVEPIRRGDRTPGRGDQKGPIVGQIPPGNSEKPTPAVVDAPKTPASEANAANPRGPKENPRLAEARAQLDKMRAERNANKAVEPPAPGENKQPEVSDRKLAGPVPAREEQANSRGPGTRLRPEEKKDKPVADPSAPTAPPAANLSNPVQPDPQDAARTALAEKRRQMEERTAAAEKARVEAAAQRAAMEQQRKESAGTENQDPRGKMREDNGRAALEERRRQLSERAEAAQKAREEADAQRTAMEQQRTEAARRATSESADGSRKNAALEEQRRQMQERAAAAQQAKEEAAAQRAAMEQQRKEAAQNEEASARDMAKKNEARAALEEQRRQMEERSAAAQKAKEEAAQQRAAMEQQRKQMEDQNRAERQAREQAQQRAAMEERAREEAMERQREAMENQRRQAQEQAREQEKMRRQAEEQAARQEQARRQAEEQAARQEQARRQAEEMQRRQAEEQARREAERQARDAERAREAVERQKGNR